jgi:hypothetical protein
MENVAEIFCDRACCKSINKPLLAANQEMLEQKEEEERGGGGVNVVSSKYLLGLLMQVVLE